MFATLLPKLHRDRARGLAAHAVPGRPEMIARLHALQSGLMARGHGRGARRHGPARIVDGTLAPPGAVLAFERMFLFAGIAFLLRDPAGAAAALRADRAESQARGPHQIDVHWKEAVMESAQKLATAVPSNDISDAKTAVPARTRRAPRDAAAVPS